MNKILLSALVIGGIAIIGVFFFMNRDASESIIDQQTQNQQEQQEQQTQQEQPDTSSETATEGSGTVFFSVTDAAANMENVSEVRMTVDNVEMHSAAQGWTTVSTDSRQFNLLELEQSGKLEFLAEAEVDADTYNQIRLHVSDVEVEQEDGSSAEAKLPSNTLRINAQVTVNDESTATVALDFEADESLHVTGDGRYIFAPVIQVETRANPSVQISGDSGVSISGGTVQTNAKFGTDINGETKAGFKIDANAELEIGPDNQINAQGQGRGGVEIDL